MCNLFLKRIQNVAILQMKGARIMELAELEARLMFFSVSFWLRLDGQRDPWGR